MSTSKKPAKPAATLKSRTVQRTQIGKSLDSVLEKAAKSGIAVEVIYLGQGVYRMRKLGPKEIQVMVDGKNVVTEIRG